MPNARLTCIKPKTLTGIFPFFPEKKARRPSNPKGLEDLSLTSVVPLDFTEEVFERIQASLQTTGSIYHNNTEYTIESRGDEIGFCLGSQPVNHINGILHDSASGEFFYFLAIDNPSQGISTELLDEGSQISYDKTYRGVINIKLYKGNIGHSATRADKLKRLREELERDRKDCSPEDTQQQNSIQEKLMQLSKEESQNDPIEIAGETVRYVEVTSVQDYL